MRSSDMICLDIAQMLGLDDEVISNVEKRCAEIDFGAISSSQNKLFDPPAVAGGIAGAVGLLRRRPFGHEDSHHNA